MFDNFKKPKTIGIIAIVLGIFMPVAINYAYLTGPNRAIFTTMWDAADMLQYFGTLLGASATIIAVTWTISFTKESAEKDRNLAENNCYRNYGIQICFDLLDVCSCRKINEIRELATAAAVENNNLEYYNYLIKMKSTYLREVILETFMKFECFYSELSETEIAKVKEMVSFFVEYSRQREKRIINKGKNSEENSSDKEQDAKYLELQNYIRKIIFNYDFTLNKNDQEKMNHLYGNQMLRL